MKTSVIIGQNFPDTEMQRILNRCDRLLIFEPLPEAAQACRYALKDAPEAIVFQAACGEMFSASTLNVYNINGLSSSLGTVTGEAFELYSGRYDLTLTATENVQVVNLGSILEMLGVSSIEELKIDAQGMDFTILKTVETWISLSRIKRIQLEADGNGFRHYDGLPDNSQESILEWMEFYPQYDMSRVENRIAEQPDFVFELVR